eukprot:scaffold8031_cov267-Pinguiococcus_pyrenoidosus.AAC.2
MQRILLVRSEGSVILRGARPAARSNSISDASGSDVPLPHGDGKEGPPGESQLRALSFPAVMRPDRARSRPFPGAAALQAPQMPSLP